MDECEYIVQNVNETLDIIITVHLLENSLNERLGAGEASQPSRRTSCLADKLKMFHAILA